MDLARIYSFFTPEKLIYISKADFMYSSLRIWVFMFAVKSNAVMNEIYHISPSILVARFPCGRYLGVLVDRHSCQCKLFVLTYSNLAVFL